MRQLISLDIELKKQVSEMRFCGKKFKEFDTLLFAQDLDFWEASSFWTD